MMSTYEGVVYLCQKYMSDDSADMDDDDYYFEDDDDEEWAIIGDITK